MFTYALNTYIVAVLHICSINYSLFQAISDPIQINNMLIPIFPFT